VEVTTPTGPARVTLRCPAQARGLVLLGHGAGGGVTAPDLVGCSAALVGAGVAVGLVEQPYRVAGRRVAAPAARLDEAWQAVVAELSSLVPGPLVVGGRSSGARVACRTATTCAAVGVLALSFPLVPPWRPDKPRDAELLGAGVPVLVVQGSRDAFGSAEDVAAVVAGAGGPGLGIDVLAVPGADHGLGRPFDVAAVVGWVLARLAGEGVG
jgi:predicted alpha/beta-hydrolase family hydrolase